MLLIMTVMVNNTIRIARRVNMPTAILISSSLPSLVIPSPVGEVSLLGGTSEMPLLVLVSLKAGSFSIKHNYVAMATWSGAMAKLCSHGIIM